MADACIFDVNPSIKAWAAVSVHFAQIHRAIGTTRAPGERLAGMILSCCQRMKEGRNRSDSPTYREFSVIRRSSVHELLAFISEVLLMALESSRSPSSSDRLLFANGHWSTALEVKNAALKVIISCTLHLMTMFSMSALGRHFWRTKSAVAATNAHSVSYNRSRTYHSLTYLLPTHS